MYENRAYFFRPMPRDRDLLKRALGRSTEELVLARALNAKHRGEAYEINGFDGEHVTARSLQKRGLVLLVPVDRRGVRYWWVQVA